MTTDMLTNEELEAICDGVSSHLQLAAGECCYELDLEDLAFSFPKIAKKLKKSRNKPSDWRGWFADEIYNDKGFCRDIAGDKIANDVSDALRRCAMNTSTENQLANSKRAEALFSRGFHIKGLFKS